MKQVVYLILANDEHAGWCVDVYTDYAKARAEELRLKKGSKGVFYSISTKVVKD